MASETAGRRVAVVTGGAGDIGRAIGRQLADDGFAVVLAVSFLASPAARTMDGAVLLLDNGPSPGTITG